MADFTGLGVDAVDEGQSQKEVTINAAIEAASQAVEAVDVPIVNGANVLTLAQSRARLIALTGALTAPATVELNGTLTKVTEVMNLTTGGFAVSVKVGSGGTLVPVTAGSGVEIWATGSRNLAAGSGGGGADFTYTTEADRRAATFTSADLGKLARVTATGLVYVILSLKVSNRANWGLVSSTAADVLNYDLNACAIGGASATHWTDGLFPSDIQPAWLVTVSTGTVFYFDLLAVPAGTYDITVDVAANNNSSDVQSCDSGGTVNGSIVNAYAAGPGAAYNQVAGTVTQATLGTLRIYFKVTTGRGFAIVKRARLSF